MEELKKCPFCGGEAEIMYISTTVGVMSPKIFCPECRNGTQWKDTEAEAIAAWNRRVTQNIGEKECSVQEGRCTFDE